MPDPLSQACLWNSLLWEWEPKLTAGNFWSSILLPALPYSLSHKYFCREIISQLGLLSSGLNKEGFWVSLCKKTSSFTTSRCPFLHLFQQEFRIPEQKHTAILRIPSPVGFDNYYVSLETRCLTPPSVTSASLTASFWYKLLTINHSMSHPVAHHDYTHIFVFQDLFQLMVLKIWEYLSASSLCEKNFLEECL